MAVVAAVTANGHPMGPSKADLIRSCLTLGRHLDAKNAQLRNLGAQLAILRGSDDPPIGHFSTNEARLARANDELAARLADALLRLDELDTNISLTQQRIQLVLAERDSLRSRLVRLGEDVRLSRL